MTHDTFSHIVYQIWYCRFELSLSFQLLLEDFSWSNFYWLISVQLFSKTKTKNIFCYFTWCSAPPFLSSSNLSVSETAEGEEDDFNEYKLDVGHKNKWYSTSSLSSSSLCAHGYYYYCCWMFNAQLFPQSLMTYTNTEIGPLHGIDSLLPLWFLMNFFSFLFCVHSHPMRDFYSLSTALCAGLTLDESFIHLIHFIPFSWFTGYIHQEILFVFFLIYFSFLCILDIIFCFVYFILVNTSYTVLS